MKNLPKIIKGSIPLTVDLYMEFTGKLITEPEAVKVNKMLVSVFNAGKNGIVDPGMKANFEEFYKLYPRKMSPKAALKAYSTALKEVTHETIMNGLRAQLPEMMIKYNTDKSWVKHPEFWLSKGCWADETADKAAPSHMMISDEKIFSTKGGQYALKKGYGYALKTFIHRYNREPTKDEFKAIMKLPLNNGDFMKAESKKLNHYLKIN